MTGDPMRDLQRHDNALPDPPQTAEMVADQRSVPRFTLLIRAAKLVTEDSEYLCVVRDASEKGISVRLFHPLPPEVPIRLEMPNGDRHALERVWEEDARAGFSFPEPVPMEQIVESPSQFARRGLRVRLHVPCELFAGVTKAEATIVNLSQQGAQISTQLPLSLLQRIKIRAEGMPEVAGKVRWRRNGQYGLSFEDTFQFAQLAALAFELQRGT
ncbi:MAG: PilZ domain-containing protein [Croceibacterium sp.]